MGNNISEICALFKLGVLFGKLKDKQVYKIDNPKIFKLRLHAQK